MCRRPPHSVSRFAHLHFGSKTIRLGVTGVVRPVYTHVRLRKCGFCETVWMAETESPVPMALTPLLNRLLTWTVLAVSQSHARQRGVDFRSGRTPELPAHPSLVGCVRHLGFRECCVSSQYPLVVVVRWLFRGPHRAHSDGFEYTAFEDGHFSANQMPVTQRGNARDVCSLAIGRNTRVFCRHTSVGFIGHPDGCDTSTTPVAREH
jgi:hypothetical protein